MTAAALQGEAVDGERRAASLDRLAGELDKEALTLAGRLDGVARAFTDAVWRGPAAQRSADGVRSNRGRLLSAADELARVAGLLRRRGGDARVEVSDLRRRAEQVRAGEEAHRASRPAA